MKKRILSLLLALLLLCGCQQNADPQTTTAPQTETTEDTTPTTEPTTEPLLEVTMTPVETVVRYPSSDFPYGVISLNGGDTVLLYDSGCDFDRYWSEHYSTYGVGVYAVQILSRTSVDKSSISMTVPGLPDASTYVRGFTEQIYNEAQYDGAFVCATMKGIDWNRAMELYVPWAEAKARYEKTGAIEDYRSQYAAEAAYTTYMENYGIYQNAKSPELEQTYYAYEVLLLTGRPEQDVTINTVELTVAGEQFSLPVGEIRLHQETLDEAFGVSEEDSVLIPYLVYYYYGYPQLDTRNGELIGVLDVDVFGKVILEKLEIVSGKGMSVAGTNISQESVHDYYYGSWMGETPFYLYDRDRISMEIHIHDPRILGNPVYHGMVQCLLHYTHAQGEGVYPIEIGMMRSPMYLPLCAIHLDQVDLTDYWAYEALLEAEWTAA